MKLLEKVSGPLPPLFPTGDGVGGVMGQAHLYYLLCSALHTGEHGDPRASLCKAMGSCGLTVYCFLSGHSDVN